MARYINEDEFIAWVKEHWCSDCQNDNGLRCRACWIDDAIDIVEEAPEADVVPKSEVEELSDRYEDLKRKYIDLAKDHDELIAWGGHIKSKDKAIIRAEVAREIFEEIEKRLLNHVADYYGCYHKTFDEIKKKYTEETNE